MAQEYKHESGMDSPRKDDRSFMPWVSSQCQELQALKVMKAFFEEVDLKKVTVESINLWMDEASSLHSCGRKTRLKKEHRNGHTALHNEWRLKQASL